MRRAHLLLCSLLALGTTAQTSPYIPPDFYGEGYSSHVVYRMNEGQVIDTDQDLRPDVKFVSEGSPLKIYARVHARVSYVVASRDTSSSGNDTLRRVDMYPTGEMAAFPSPQAVSEAPGVANYYYPWTGSSSEGVTAHRRVVYQNLFPYTDLHYYSGSGGPKLALVLRAGADPANVKLKFDGHDQIDIDVDGNLKILFGNKWVTKPWAVAYQISTGGTIIPMTWNGRWEYRGAPDILGFYFGLYNPALPLVLLIGPPPAAGGGGAVNLSWSTMVGDDFNTDNSGVDCFNAADADLDGNIYVAGNTGDEAFPALAGMTIGPYNGGPSDAIIGKFLYAPGVPTQDAFNPWMTYFGGNGWDKALATHYSAINDRLTCTGWTTSDDDLFAFPTIDPSDGTFWQGALKGEHDGFIAHFDPDDGTLLRSTYFGGDDDDMVSAITEDEVGNLYFSGGTTSEDGFILPNCESPSSGFPLCDPIGANYQQNSNEGGRDAFMVKMDVDHNLLWSTFLGGAGDDLGYDMTYYNENDPDSKRVVVVGTTTGIMPHTGPSGVYQQNGSGPSNGFIATFRPTGVQRWSTEVNGLRGLYATDHGGVRLFVMGATGNWIPSVSTSCTPVSGNIAICDPGGGATVDDDLSSSWPDQYLAEFDVKTGELYWSTLVGDDATEYSEQGDLYYWESNFHLFEFAKFFDLEVDADGNLYALGLTAQDSYIAPTPFPTLPAYGYYYKEFNPDQGDGQTEITLQCYNADRSLYWSSLFGSWFEHGANDFTNFPFGADFGHQLVLVQDECLYWVGITGGWNFDDECPYPFPGASYCEAPTPEGIIGDGVDGFIARMDLQGLTIGIADPAVGDNVLVLSPVPAEDVMTATWQRSPWNGTIVIHDALGQIVRRTFVTGGQVDVSRITSGAYVLTLLTSDGSPLTSRPFLVR